MTQRVDLSELAQCAFCVGDNLRMTARAVSHHYEERLRPIGLRISQYTILANVAAQEPITITELAAALQLDRTTLTRNLKPLEREGFVHTLPGEDRRQRVVTMTDAGHAKLAEAFPLWKAAQADLIDRLGAERWENIRRDLAALVALTR